MKTKKQTEKQELKYAPGDKVIYHCAGVDREGLIAYVDDTDNVAPYRINGMNIRESDIVEKVAKRRGRPAAKKQVEEKTEVVVNAEPKQKPEEPKAVESIQEEEPLQQPQQPSCNEVHEQEQETEQTLAEKYQAFKSTINMAEFNDLVDLVTADTKKMRELMAKSMQAIANDCGLKA